MNAADVDWAVGVLAGRRRRLVSFAPVLWRPAVDAERAHASYLRWVLENGGLGFRTEAALLVAVPGPDASVVDDAAVPDGTWSTVGAALWAALEARAPGEPVRFVCPVPDAERTAFATRSGLARAESWWHRDVPGHGAASEAPPHLPGAAVSVVPAPPVYDPGGPVLFVEDVTDEGCLVRAPAEAARLGCPLVVVGQPVTSTSLAAALSGGGYRRHCDFHTGPLRTGPP